MLKKYFTEIVFRLGMDYNLHTLILMGKIVSDLEQLSFRTTFWNGLCLEPRLHCTPSLILDLCIG